MASMISTKTLEESQSRAATLKEINPVGGCSRSRFNSLRDE